MTNCVISKQRCFPGFVDWRKRSVSLWSFTVEGLHTKQCPDLSDKGIHVILPFLQLDCVKADCSVVVIQKYIVKP